MKYGKKIQLSLLSIGIILFVLTYFYYPDMKKKQLLIEQNVENNKKEPISGAAADQYTSFENIEYVGLYDFNKPFKVNSEKAYTLKSNTDVVYMSNMHVIMYLEDGRIVNITSDKGSYNKLNYDCYFEQNVKATDGSTEILAQNLDLLATDNAAEIYNNVSLKDPNGSLQADNIKYNFETKSFKVSMFKDELVKMKVVQ
jgi:LPS export ABC transporter protein LptC